MRKRGGKERREKAEKKGSKRRNKEGKKGRKKEREKEKQRNEQRSRRKKEELAGLVLQARLCSTKIGNEEERMSTQDEGRDIFPEWILRI